MVFVLFFTVTVADVDFMVEMGRFGYYPRPSISKRYILYSIIRETIVLLKNFLEIYLTLITIFFSKIILKLLIVTYPLSIFKYRITV